MYQSASKWFANLNMHLKMRSYHIIFATLLMLFLCSPTSAQQGVIGEVIIGENGYEIPVEVINKNEEAIKSVTVKLIEKPAGFKNATIEPQQVDTLAVGKTAVFMLQFDVDENAEAQDFAEIIFSVEAENAEFDEPQPVVAVAITKREGYRPLTLRLVNIEATEDGKKVVYGRCRFDHKSGDAGFSASCEPDEYRVENVASFGFTQFPIEIVLGQPFEFVADMKWRTRHRKSGYCSTRWADDPQTLSRCVMGNLRPVLFYGWSGNGPSDGPDTDESGESTVRLSFIPKSCKVGVTEDIDCSSPEGLKWLGGDERKASADYVYTVKTTPPLEGLVKDKVLFFHPDYLQSVEGGFVRKPVHPNKGIASTMLKYAIKATEEETVYGKTIKIYLADTFGDAFVALHYRPVMVGGSHIASASPYRHPDSVQNAGIGDGPEETESPEDVAKAGPTDPEEGSPDQDAPSSAAGSGQTNTSTDRQSQDSKKRSTKTNDSKVKKSGLDPDKPGSINANHPKTAAIIKEWISSAEPPMNATHGADARYEPWGRFVRKIIGGVGRVTGNPDDTAGRTPEKYVWDKRDTLDSVDHCTLGEYVTAKLKNQSIDHCKERYKPGVSDVVGMSKKRAEKELKGKGLKTKVSLGSPASTKQDSLTVEKTIPDAGSTIKRGGMVTLVVHPPFVDRRTVPEFKGSTAEEVISKIKDVGLKPKKNTVKASSAIQSGKVNSLDPPPGTEILAGATVFVDVFGPFDNRIKIPDVIGLKIRKAADVIKAAGFTPAFELGADTKDPKKDKTIARQIPEPGMKIVAGSEIKMFIYTLKAESKSIPNLVGMPLTKAQKVLQRMGLSMSAKLGEDASKAQDTGHVYKQSPKSGSEVTKNVAVTVWVYGEQESPKDGQAGGVPSLQCNGFVAYMNAGIPGYNKEVVNNISLERCKQICKERSWCKSVDYERKVGRCYVQNANKSDAPLKTNYSGNPYDHYECVNSQTTDVINTDDASNSSTTGNLTPNDKKTATVAKCEDYNKCLAEMMQQIQQLSLKMASGQSSTLGCKYLGLGQAMVRVSKDANSAGCPIAGNYEHAGDMIKEQARQMCGGQTIPFDIDTLPGCRGLGKKTSTDIVPDIHRNSELQNQPAHVGATIWKVWGPIPYGYGTKCFTDEEVQAYMKPGAKKSKDGWFGRKGGGTMKPTGKSCIKPGHGRKPSGGKVIFSDSVDSFDGRKAANANKVPDVIGLGIQEAANEVKAAGFTPAFELGADTTDPVKDKTIARQVPKPGKGITPGSEIKMFIFNLKARSKTVPNLIGMDIAKAQKVLQEKGLSMAPELGDDASKVNDVGRVYKQSPKSGSEVSEDMAINVWVYGERSVEEKPLATNSGGVPFVTIPDLPAGWPITIEISNHFGGWTGLNDSKVRRGQQYSRPTNGFLAKGNKVREIFISNSKMVLRVFWLENADKIPLNRLLYDGIDFVRLCSSRKSRPFFTPRYGTTVYPVGDDRFTSLISDSINYQSSRAWARVQLYAVAGLIEQNKAKYFRIVKDMMAEIEPYAKSCQDDK